jgi:hypothetical protein
VLLIGGFVLVKYLFYSFQEKFFGVILHMLVLSHHKSRRGA